MLDILKHLTSTPGPAGSENKVAELLQTYIKKLGLNSHIDNMGNLVATIKGKNPDKSIAIVVHTDEVSLLVKYISDDGFIYFDLNGMIDTRILLGLVVDVISDQGTYPGAIGVKGKHLLTETDLNNQIVLENLWIDVGASSKTEVHKLGIKIGDPIVFHPNFQLLGKNHVLSKALDNRIGCVIMLDLLKNLKNTTPNYTLHFVAAVQEEIGSRGAKVAAQILHPTQAIIIDTTPARDPTTSKQQTPIEVGKGPVIRIVDSATVYSKEITKQLISIAQKHKLNFQLDVATGFWTDASTIHTVDSGIPSGGIFIPRFSSHSPVETANINDIKQTSSLVLEYLKLH